MRNFDPELEKNAIDGVAGFSTEEALQLAYELEETAWIIRQRCSDVVTNRLPDDSVRWQRVSVN